MRFALALASVLALTLTVPAATVAPGEHAMTHVSAIDGTEQPYNLFVPTRHERDEALPLVVVLHGLGSSWRAWFARTTVCDWAEREGWIVAAPHGRGNWYYLGPGETDVLEVIDEVKRQCNVDESRIYLLGHSMGGWGTWQLGVSHPDLFAAIVPMAGWAPLELLPNLRNTPVMLIHGAVDTVVPVERAREAAQEMRRLGLEHRYLEATESGHESRLISTLMPMIAEWLRDKRRVERPMEITLRAFTPRRARSHWLAILDTGEFPDLASLDVRVEHGDSERRLHYTLENVTSVAIDTSRLPGWETGYVGLHERLEDIPVDPATPWVIAERTEDGTLNLRTAAEATPPPSPVVAHLDEPLEDTLPTIGRILAEATGADTAIIRDVYDCPELPAGDVTLDLVADMYLRPMDELHIAEMTASAIASITESGRNRMAPEVPLDDPDRIYTVALPVYQVRRLPEGIEAEGLGVRICEVICDHVVATGGLP